MMININISDNDINDLLLELCDEIDETYSDYICKDNRGRDIVKRWLKNIFNDNIIFTESNKDK